MNREFKFRLWSKSEKCFVNPNILEVWDESGKMTPFQFVKTGKLDPIYMPVENYVIQQYTGLIDKYDNPIYEGDIVKWDNLNYLVEWNDIAYKWQGRCPYYHSYHHPTTEHFRDLMNGVIVGNYFENNDLLK